MEIFWMAGFFKILSPVGGSILLSLLIKKSQHLFVEEVASLTAFTSISVKAVRVVFNPQNGRAFSAVF